MFGKKKDRKKLEKEWDKKHDTLLKKNYKKVGLKLASCTGDDGYKDSNKMELIHKISKGQKVNEMFLKKFFKATLKTFPKTAYIPFSYFENTKQSFLILKENISLEAGVWKVLIKDAESESKNASKEDDQRDWWLIRNLCTDMEKAIKRFRKVASSSVKYYKEANNKMFFVLRETPLEVKKQMTKKVLAQAITENIGYAITAKGLSVEVYPSKDAADETLKKEEAVSPEELAKQAKIKEQRFALKRMLDEYKDLRRQKPSGSGLGGGAKRLYWLAQIKMLTRKFDDFCRNAEPEVQKEAAKKRAQLVDVAEQAEQAGRNEKDKLRRKAVANLTPMWKQVKGHFDAFVGLVEKEGKAIRLQSPPEKNG